VQVIVGLGKVPLFSMISLETGEYHVDHSRHKTSFKFVHELSTARSVWVTFVAGMIVSIVKTKVSLFENDVHKIITLAHYLSGRPAPAVQTAYNVYIIGT
jgi:hypothetical protein